ncbi:DNA repair protein RecO [Georgenia sp. Z1344]|uniref:DNA repair protein RecO n=1 Tax=Georgenia sp. Z1344 TaxID=3416706 RepID=UPI003CEFD1F5
MRLYRDEAVVLRSHDLSEADRIVTMLSREHGLVRAVAKGVRRTSSRFGARLEPFTVVDVQLHRGRNLDTVTQVETIAPYGRSLATDYSLFTSATVMVETANQLTEAEEVPAPQQYILLIGALHAMSMRRHAATLVLDSYLLRSLAVAGWAPSCYDCARCGADGPHRAWSTQMGGAMCASCRPPGSASPAEETMTLLGALLSGDWPVADASHDRHRTEASGLVAAHLQYHLERRLRSLPFVERA